MKRKSAFIGMMGIFVIVVLLGASFQSGDDLFQKALRLERNEGKLEEAVALYKMIVNESKDFPLAAKAQLRIGLCYEKLGNEASQQALEAFQKVVENYPDQTDIVKQARTRLAALGGTAGTGELVARRILKDASGIRGVLSADGRFIRRVDRETGDVVQFEIASGQTNRITNKGPWSETEMYNSESFCFSHDGKKIAYLTSTEDWDPLLRIRNLDGSGLRTLKEAYIFPRDWSPDGRFILALSGQNEQVELTLISTADGSVRILRNFETSYFFVQNARFSPDGRFIALNFVREGNPSHGDVFLMTADGRNETVVAGHLAEDYLLGWAPDGESLILLSNRYRSGAWDLWNVPVAGGKQQGEPMLLKKNFGYDVDFFGFAPDGSCYYSSYSQSGGLFEGMVDLDTGKVLVTPARLLTRYTGRPWQPHWSPDGRNLLYLSNRGNIGPENNILTIRSAATGEERFLALRFRFINQIGWSPDGRSVIMLGLTEKEGGLFRINTETSGITQLRDGGLFPRLCPDGKTLVFIQSGGPGGPIIMKRNLETGKESEVTRAGNAFYDISPDGNEVVFHIDGAVKIVSLDGGEPREIIRDLAEYYRLQWTGDGRSIIAQTLFVPKSVNLIPKSEIWRVPVDGGTPLKLDLSIPGWEFFALHPDNRRFVFSVNEGSETELWVLENFLPEKKSNK